MEDAILPFMIEGSRVRGRLVRLGPVVDRILTRHHYPQAVAQLLGETLALTGVLAGMLKDDGIFTLQARGDGAIGLLVADLASDGALRGCATYDDAALAETLRGATSAPLPRLLGNGYLAFTIDRGGDSERYRGLVELTGATLAECLRGYFRQSEQIQAGIATACARHRDCWRAGAIMVQPIPEQGGVGNCGGGLNGCGQGDEDWRRALTLMSSVRLDELTAADLSPEQLLYRLFHEDGVRLFDFRCVTDRCRCSLARVEQVLRSLSNERMEEMTVDGIATVTCEFCNRSYRFDRPAIARLHAEIPD